MPSQCVKVMVRCRPMNTKQSSNGNKKCVEVDLASNQISLNKPDDNETQKQFTFDSLFDETSTQTQIYETSAFGLVESAFQGYNGTIFAYGQTGIFKY